jgi:signal transduction histidine kinase/CheY-like chemotaxis protein
MRLLNQFTNEFRNLLFLLSRQDAERLLSAFHALTSLRSFDAKLARAATVTAQLLACDRTSILIGEGASFASAGSYGNVPDERIALPHQRIDRDDPLVARVLAARRCLVLRGSSLRALAAGSRFDPGGVDTVAIAPILGEDQMLLGLITAEYYARPTRFTPLRAALLSGAGHLVGLAVVEDRQLAESAALSNRLKEFEQLQLIARLCGGVAHDVNNALTVILGNAEYIHRAMPAEDDLDDAYRQLMLAVEHASSLARNLLALGQHSVVQDRIVSVDAVIGQAESLFSSHLGRKVRLSLALGAQAVGVQIDPQQLEQLVTNLVINAGDAIVDEGTVTVTTDRVPADQARGEVAAGQCGFVRIEVADDGVGISAAELERIREPFFTHKDRSMHSGIGLATVDAILRRVGGSLAIDSAPDEGTRATVLLPARPAPASAEVQLEHGRIPEDWSGVKVLVVEDHPAIRRLTAEAFAGRGCQVIEAETGQQALALCEAEPDVDLLISDVLMPGINGPELAERLRERCPYLRAMFISGYADGRALDAHLKQHNDQFLSKPFTRAQLIARAFETLRS